MKTNSFAQGFAAHTAIAILLFAGVAGFAGYKIVTTDRSAATNIANSQTTTREPQAIKSQADLTATDKALDDSAAQLDSQLDDSALDADLNALL